MPKRFILQLETATQVCSVAVSVDGIVLAFRDLNEPNAHAANLTLLVEQVMHESGISFADLSAVAVSKGPGSYTGLRIGVSTAKGLCYATGLPLIAINTLESMAEGFKATYPNSMGPNILRCPMVDARRMEVYMAVYDHQNQQLKPDTAEVINNHSFNEFAGSYKIILFGTGADKFKDLFANHGQVTVVSDFQNAARHSSQLAYDAFTAGTFENLVYFEPHYLKDFVATTPKHKPL